MESRLLALEAKVKELSEALHRVETRLAQIEGESSPENEAVAEPTPVVASSTSIAAVKSAASHTEQWLTLLGRTFLVLAGAFVIRAITDGGLVPGWAGAALGLAFAVTWLFFSRLAGRAGLALSAFFHGLSTALIAYPLVVETTTRLAVISQLVATAVIAVITLLLIGVARLARRQPLVWVSFAGFFASWAILLPAGVSALGMIISLFVLVVACAWLAEDLHWEATRWPVAIILDLVLFGYAVAVTRHGSPTAGAALVSTGLSVIALVLFLAAAGARTLGRGRPTQAFEVAQSFGIVMVTGAVVGLSSPLVPWLIPAASGVAVVLAIGAEALAFTAFDRREDHAGVVSLSALGLLMLLAARLPGMPLAWAGVAALAAVAGRQRRPGILFLYSLVLVLASATATGLLAVVFDGFRGSPTGDWAELNVLSVVTLVVAAGAYAATTLSAGTPDDVDLKVLRRLPPLVLLLLLSLAGAALLLHGLRAAGLSPTEVGMLAAVRSVGLAVIALLLAFGARWIEEAQWAAYLITGLGGLKLLGEDLRVGRAATLLVTFLAYGLALVCVPKLVKIAAERRA